MGRSLLWLQKSTLYKSLCKIKFPLPVKDLLVNLSEFKVYFESLLKSRWQEIQIKN